MNKPRNLTISIPEPCSVPWNSMHAVDDYRRHCDSCATVVTDFSSMTDDELVSYLQNKVGQHTCGRFRKDQLGKPLPLLPVQKRKAVWWKAALLLPLTFIHKIGNAQQQDILTTAKKDSLVAVTQNSDSSFTAQQDTSGVANDSLSQLAVVDSLYQDIPDSLRAPLKWEKFLVPNCLEEMTYICSISVVYGGLGITVGLTRTEPQAEIFKPQGLSIGFRDTLKAITVAIREFNKNIPRTDQSQPAPPPQQPAVPAQNENLVAVLTDNKRVPKRNN